MTTGRKASVHNVAEGVVTGLILINLPVAAWAEITHNELAEHIDYAILWFFAVEITWRWLLAAQRRRATTWLIVDTLIVGLALSGLPIMRVARLAHLSRHMHHLRHASLARWFKFGAITRVDRQKGIKNENGPTHPDRRERRRGESRAGGARVR